MEDKRAHDRIDKLEAEQSQFARNLAENTQLTKTIAANTSEIVELFKGVKGFRTFVLWCAPLVAIVIATWAWIKAH